MKLDALGGSQSLRRVVLEEEEDKEGSAVTAMLLLGPSVVQSWVGGPGSVRAELAFWLFCLSVVHPKVILPSQILDTKWESVTQKNVNHLLSSITAETSWIIHIRELSKDLLIWAK